MIIKSSQPYNVYDIIKLQAEHFPDASAITAPGREPITYKGLYVQLNYIVDTLCGLGIGCNDRVALVLPNGPELAVTFLGVASGAAAAPLNPAYRTEEYQFYLSDLNAKALIVPSNVNSTALNVAESLDMCIISLSSEQDKHDGTFTLDGESHIPGKEKSYSEDGDIALVLHTSGTTSRPKIVPLTHFHIAKSAYNIQSSLNLERSDRCLNIMPLFHVHGLIGGLLSSMVSNASVVCTPGLIGPQFFTWMDECRPTWYTAVPTMHQTILANAENNKSVIKNSPLRFIRSCSASLPKQVMAELESTFHVPVVEAYGMTEASHQMSINPLPPGTRKPGSVGQKFGIELGIMDETGNLLPPNVTGEIVIQGQNVFEGYENNPDANAESFTHGWFRTGDEGYLDNDGYLFITGRIKEIINRGGEKISPREIDEVLLNHPDVKQAVTFAIPDARLGEEIAAAVILREGSILDGRMLRDFAAVNLAEFKVPRKIIIVEDIPKGPTGKLQRIGLAESFGLSEMAIKKSNIKTGYVAPSNPIEELLVGIWEEVLGIEKIGVFDGFDELGGDSLLAAQIIARLREEVEIELTMRDFFDTPTIASMADVVVSILLAEID